MQIPIFNIFNIIVSVLSDDKKTKHQGVSAVVVLVRYAHIHTECIWMLMFMYMVLRDWGESDSQSYGTANSWIGCGLEQK